MIKVIKIKILKFKEFLRKNGLYILIVLCFYLLFNIKLPYIVYAPGGYISLDERIKINNNYESSGELGMAYVTMYEANVPILLLSYILPNWDLVKNEEVTYEDESLKEMNNRDKVYLQNAIDSATIAAYNLTNNYLEISNSYNNVEYITKEAQTTLKLGDKILLVDGIKYSGTPEITSYIQTLTKGDIVKLTVLRDNKEIETTAKVFIIDGVKKIGVLSIMTYDYTTKPKIKVIFENDESGPSGGLMTALCIYDTLTKKDLTNGKKVIGTGTIDVDGKVGEIGGVKYKLLGAVKNKARIFICPKENLKEALKVKKDNHYDIIIVGVSTLDEAITALQKEE